MITIINKIVNIYVPDTILIPLFKYKFVLSLQQLLMVDIIHTLQMISAI